MTRGVDILASCALAALLGGCPQSVRPLEADGGAGGDASGPDTGRVSDAGPRLDGGDPSDAGGVDGGPGPSGFRWSRMSLPADTRGVTAVWGRGPNEVYFGATNGDVLRFDGARVEDVWDAPNNFGVRALGGTATRIFVASERDLYVFEGDLSDVPDAYGVGNAIGGLSVVADDLAFLVSERTSSRGLFRYDGNAVDEVAPDLNVASVNGVWAELGPRVWVAGNGRFPYYDGLGTSEDTVSWPAQWSATDIAYFFVYDIGGFAGHRLAVGSGGGVLSDADGTWRFERAPDGDADFEAVAPMPGGPAGGPELAVAVGEAVDGAVIHWRTADGWRGDPFEDRVTLMDVWAASADEVFAVGFNTGSIEGVVLRGVRR